VSDHPADDQPAETIGAIGNELAPLKRQIAQGSAERAGEIGRRFGTSPWARVAGLSKWSRSHRPPSSKPPTPTI
jgi:hypothetical protein